MVKKINGKVGGKASKIQSSRAVETVGVGEAKEVDKTTAKTKTKSIGSERFALGAADREMILKMIEEEAETLFAKDSQKKDISKKAVRMAIDSSLIPSDDEDG